MPLSRPPSEAATDFLVDNEEVMVERGSGMCCSSFISVAVIKHPA